MWTPEGVDKYIQKLIEILNPTHEPIYVDFKAEPEAKPSDCFPIVEQKVENQGGKMILGWQIWKTNNLVEAEFHAVWETPDGDLLDISPKEIIVDKILFVEDNNLKYEGKQIDNVRLNITKNSLVDDLILINKTIFAFLNRGKRAEIYDLSDLLSNQQIEHLAELKELRFLISAMVESGATRNSLCICKSGRKFKNCHGYNFIKSINKIK